MPPIRHALALANKNPITNTAPLVCEVKVRGNGEGYTTWSAGSVR